MPDTTLCMVGSMEPLVLEESGVMFVPHNDKVFLVILSEPGSGGNSFTAILSMRDLYKIKHWLDKMLEEEEKRSW